MRHSLSQPRHYLAPGPVKPGSARHGNRNRPVPYRPQFSSEPARFPKKSGGRGGGVARPTCEMTLAGVGRGRPPPILVGLARRRRPTRNRRPRPASGGRRGPCESAVLSSFEQTAPGG
ncbi:hypothetical protein NL676_031810 [Syzygium grande]|nr:hypothetical protein NL676_031810 [Syzygium grande]